MESKSQEYGTPDELFLPLHEEFHFELDGCASKKYHKVSHYYSKEDDCFTKHWDKTTWVNPEFKTVKKFVVKAYEDSEKFTCTIVVLVLSKTNTNWWRDYAFKAKEILFVNQKITFEGQPQGLRFPASILVFSPHRGKTKFSVFSQCKIESSSVINIHEEKFNIK